MTLFLILLGLAVTWSLLRFYSSLPSALFPPQVDEDGPFDFDPTASDIRSLLNRCSIIRRQMARN